MPEINSQYRAHPHLPLFLGDSQPSPLDPRRIYLVSGICFSVSHHPTEDDESRLSQTMVSGEANDDFNGPQR